MIKRLGWNKNLTTWSKISNCLNVIYTYNIMTSSNGKNFRVTGHLCGEFTCHQWIPHKNASDAELWCFLWFAQWIVNGWVNNCEAGDFRRHCAYDDFIVIIIALFWICSVAEYWVKAFVWSYNEIYRGVIHLAAIQISFILWCCY